jgi:hypothetical protein
MRQAARLLHLRVVPRALLDRGWARCERGSARIVEARQGRPDVRRGVEPKGSEAGNGPACAPSAVALVTVPEMVRLTGGRWRARCQFCKTESVLVPAVDAAQAWGQLEQLGWVIYRAVPAAMPKALSKACGEKNAAIMEAVKAARKSRKRK